MQNTVIHPGAVKELNKLLGRENMQKIRRIFLVTGKRSFEESGVHRALEDQFPQAEIVRFSDFSVNPKIEDIEKGLKLYKQGSAQDEAVVSKASYDDSYDAASGTSHKNSACFDLVIAAGGGTPIDVAKSIRFLAGQAASAEQTVSPTDILLNPHKIKKSHAKSSSESQSQTSSEAETPPLLVIPTTAGSGSEATHFAVVYYGGKKYSLAHESMLPDYVCIDAEVTYSLPGKIAAYTGMDALCQAIEAYWSVNASDESQKYSRHAIQLILGRGRRTLEKSDDAARPLNKNANDIKLTNIELSALYGDRPARAAMLEAAHFAGKAINITKTTGAHAFSYFLTSRHQIPHGQAVGLLIDAFILFNDGVGDGDVSDPRGTEYVRRMLRELYSILGVRTARDAAELIRRLREHLSLDLGGRLGQSGQSGRPLADLIRTDSDKHEFFASVNLQRLKNNPRLIQDSTIDELKAAMFNS